MTNGTRIRLLTTAAFLALGIACSDDVPTEDAGEVMTAELLGPTGVAAAVIDFVGIASVEVAGGDAFTRQVATGLRAVIVLHEPGRMRLTLVPSIPGSATSATVVDVADETYDQPESLEAYHVDLGS